MRKLLLLLLLRPRVVVIVAAAFCLLQWCTLSILGRQQTTTRTAAFSGSRPRGGCVSSAAASALMTRRLPREAAAPRTASTTTPIVSSRLLLCTSHGARREAATSTTSLYGFLHNNNSADVVGAVASTTAARFSRRQAVAHAVTACATAVATTAVAADPAAVAMINSDASLLCTSGEVAAAAASSLLAIPIQASWTAVDGLNTVVDDTLVAFDSSAYAAMRDDPTRTPYFRAAIQNRISGDGETVVLDLGTGPYALFAIMAAEAGAARVYAMETNAKAAELARVTVNKSGWADVITVLEGLSTDMVLPEKVDVVIAEIVGSVSTEEGVLATIRDAHKRHVKRPDEDASWIPHRIQTLAAPASYTLHNLFRPPEFDWCKLQGEPVRFNCRDEGLQLLSTPQLLEDISFASINNDRSNKSSGDFGKEQKQQLSFVVDAVRIRDNQGPLLQEFKRGGSSNCNDLAVATSHSFSGIAMWPRLFLQKTTTTTARNVDDSIMVESRQYPNGEHQRSHWQTVLPIMTGQPLPNLVGGERVVVNFIRREPPSSSSTSSFPPPPRYSLEGNVFYNS